MTGTNRARVFGDLLSIDAWHDPFISETGEASVYAEISFHEGRLGGDDEDVALTFKVTLRRALLTVNIEHPLRFKRDSLPRDVPDSDAELTKIISAKSATEKSTSIDVKTSMKMIALALKGENHRSNSISDDEILKIVKNIPRILVRSRPSNSQEYSWEMSPTYETHLQGQPWDPIENPRMTVILPEKKAPIDPVVKITVSCNREDILISDIKMKDENLQGRFTENVFREMNEKAAIHHIKLILSRADLEPGKLDNRFSKILLADVIAKPE